MILDVLELQNMFTTAAQLAKAENKYEPKFEYDEQTVTELIQKAFPKLKDKTRLDALVKQIMTNPEY